MTNAIVLAQELLACLQTALAAGPQPIPANHVMLRAGAQVTPLLGTARDECCEGLGWVRVQSVSGVRQLDDRLNVTCFEADRTLTLEMGVVRCAPSADASSVPSEDQWTAAALQLDADMGSMEAAVCCAFGDLEGSAAEEISVGEYQPLGVDGNCIGGTMTVLIRMTNCC
jgi:hypothetical protein